MIELYNGDCLDIMKNIKDENIDMILCDLPYGTTRNAWDSVIPLDELWEQYERIIKESDKNLHPTQKPVLLLEYLIKTYTNENDTVLDCFMGSGSTGVACRNTNRNFIGIELNKDYFDIAKQRIENGFYQKDGNDFDTNGIGLF